MHKPEFDNEQMRTLYDVGYEFGSKGGTWIKVPPGFAPPDASIAPGAPFRDAGCIMKSNI